MQLCWIHKNIGNTFFLYFLLSRKQAYGECKSTGKCQNDLATVLHLTLVPIMMKTYITIATFHIAIRLCSYCQLRQELLQPSRPTTDPPTPPHFFRSHRSSTLDFHFLSHYSYIKAIMLYKGNHWTRCAGFMDASWVRLGITNDDLGTSWALPGDNLKMTWG